MQELSSFVLISLVWMIRPLKGPNLDPLAMTVLVQNTPWWTDPANVVCTMAMPEIIAELMEDLLMNCIRDQLKVTQ